MTRCESYPPCFGTIYFPTAPSFFRDYAFFTAPFFYCTEAIPEPRVQVFAPLRSAQSTRPLDELRPIFRTDVLN